jgi:hypothetical protein
MPGDGAYISDTYISHLPNSPVWNPPAVPTYGHFTQIFDSLPSQQPGSAAISIAARWDWMALEFLMQFWLLTSFIGVLYLITRHTHVDRLLHVVLHVAIGLTSGAGACIGLWPILGGWGPPAPLFFGISGLILGIALGASGPKNSRDSAT